MGVRLRGRERRRVRDSKVKRKGWRNGRGMGKRREGKENGNGEDGWADGWKQNNS